MLVTLGVDTHSDIHVAALLDHLGRLLEVRSFPSSSIGYRALLCWARSHGDLRFAGVEGTGSYGAGLARYLTTNHVCVLEVGRPNRQDRRRLGKSDATDAESAARSVLSGTALGVAKLSTGPVESIRVLRAVRRSALKARTQILNQLRAVLLTAPDDLRSRFSRIPLDGVLAAASRSRPRDPIGLALRILSRRYSYLTSEISDLDCLLSRLVSEASPGLVSLPGFGTDTAGALLVAAGENPERLSSEASFASLCGVAPVPASSGKTLRYRLNRGGNRDANRALHVVAICRMSFDRRTKTYVARRTADGKAKPEIVRCLKRYIAREAYKVLVS